MDAIGFLYVSRSSSTIQLHHSLGSRCAGASSKVDFNRQIGDRVWGVYIVLLCVFFLWAKELNGKDSHKETFPVYGGKRLSRKAVHSWVEKLPPWWQTFRWWRRGWNGGVKVAETTVKRHVCCWFRCTGKAMGKVVEDMSRNKVFSRFEYHMFFVLYPFVTLLLTLPRRYQIYASWNFVTVVIKLKHKLGMVHLFIMDVSGRK
jgi:hypothetical protein